jgi:hypothetical protein
VILGQLLGYLRGYCQNTFNFRELHHGPGGQGGIRTDLICKGILAVLLPINVPINGQVGSKPFRG